MRKILLAATAAFISAPALAEQAQPRLTDAERAQAVQELQDLRARINRLETRLGVSTEPPPIQYTPAPEKRMKDHNLELYGFVQLDAIQDFKRVNRTGMRLCAPQDPDARRRVRGGRTIDFQRPPIASRREGDRAGRRQALRGQVRI